MRARFDGWKASAVLWGILVLAPRVGVAQEPPVPEGDSVAPVEVEVEVEAESDGPVLELEGLEDPGSPAVSPAAEASAKAAGADPFAGRTDKDATLAERTASIIDRTTLGGYGQHEYIVGKDEISRFRNHRWVLFVYSQITDRISTATEVEFEFAGSPAKKSGVLGAGEVLLEFAVVDVEIFEWLVIRGGVILMPVGAFNIRHDAPTRDLVDRPIAYTSIVPTTWFESGAGLLGKLELPADMRLSYELYVVNGLDARIFDGHGLRAARGSHFEDNNDDKAFVGRVAWSPALGLELGVSGYTGDYDKRGGRVNLGNIDLMIRYGIFEFIAEAVYAQIDGGFVEGFPASSPANTRDPVPEGMWGFFLQGSFHIQIDALWAFFPEWLQDAVVTAVLRYEGMDTDINRRSAAGDKRRMTLGLNLRPVEAFVWKFDLQWNSAGQDNRAMARDFWQGGFWKHRDASFLPDRFVASVAYLF